MNTAQKFTAKQAYLVAASIGKSQQITCVRKGKQLYAGGVVLDLVSTVNKGALRQMREERLQQIIEEKNALGLLIDQVKVDRYTGPTLTGYLKKMNELIKESARLKAEIAGNFQ